MKTKNLLPLLATAFASILSLGWGIPAHAGGADAQISGYVFKDLNKNGHDDNEPRVSGTAVLLERAVHTLQPDETAITNANGEFAFVGLQYRAYKVCVAVLPPWIPSTPECVTVALSPKESEAEVAFGVFQPTPQPSPTPVSCVRPVSFWADSLAADVLVPALVPGTMTLGSVAYTAPQLAQILDQPTVGNALLVLGHQLIAARLNVRAGASANTIGPALASADAAIGTLVMPPIGTGGVAPNTQLGTAMTNFAIALANYNNGNLGPVSCP